MIIPSFIHSAIQFFGLPGQALRVLGKDISSHGFLNFRNDRFYPPFFPVITGVPTPYLNSKADRTTRPPRDELGWGCFRPFLEIPW